MGILFLLTQHESRIIQQLAMAVLLGEDCMFALIDALMERGQL